MNHRERMDAGLPYLAWEDGLEQERRETRRRLQIYNALAPEESARAAELLREILGSCGENACIEPPFRCDYGRNFTVGENFYANYNLVVLDVGKVSVGRDVRIGPNVGLYAAGHPLHPDPRRAGWEYGADIVIGDDVWIGGSACVLAGVSIGRGTVVAAGSVVNRDLPEGVLAAGNPCRALRPITKEDRPFYFRGLRFGPELADLPPASPGEGPEAPDPAASGSPDGGNGAPVLIILRGNAASGKTTLARELRRRWRACGRRVLLLSQDAVRREMLSARDGPDPEALPLLEDLLRYGRAHADAVILEGILPGAWYAPLFAAAREAFGSRIFAYRYALPLEETLRRHRTRPEQTEFGEAELRRWWREADPLPGLPEGSIGPEESVREAADRIWRETGAPADPASGPDGAGGVVIPQKM